MAFARGAQAHDEAQAAFGHAALVRMRHDGGIEQRGGFQRIFAGEKRADEQLRATRESGRCGEDVRLHFLDSAAAAAISMSKCRESNSAWTRCKLRVDLLLGQRERAADDGGDAVALPGMKGRMMTRALSGQERDLVAAEADGLHERDAWDVAIRCSA